MMGRTVSMAVFVAVFLSAPSSIAEVLYVRAETAFLRVQPDLDSDVVARVGQGTLLDVIERVGHWNRVRVRDTSAEGYIHSAFVETATELPSPDPPAAPVGNEPQSEPPPAAAAPPSREAVAPPPAPSEIPSGPPGEPMGNEAPRRAPPGDPDSEQSLGEGTGDLDTYDLTVWGGIYRAELSVGGAFSVAPFSDPALGIEIGVDYTDFGSPTSSSNSLTSVGGDELTVLASFNYHFVFPGVSMRPYIGGGLIHSRISTPAIVDARGFTLSTDATLSETGLQIGGGVKVPILGGGTYFRADLRYVDSVNDTARIFMGLTF